MHFFFFIGVVEFIRILLVLMGQKSSNGAKRCTITTNSSVSMHEVLCVQIVNNFKKVLPC